MQQKQPESVAVPVGSAERFQPLRVRCPDRFCGIIHYLAEAELAGRVTDFGAIVRLAWENGYKECFNGKLRDDLLNREIFTSLREARVLVRQWRTEYNRVWPHSSLGYRPSAPEAVEPPLLVLTV